MKNKIIVGFLFSFLIPTCLAFAYIPSSFDPGGKNNPFYFQEIQDYDTEKRNQNTLKENNLKSTYGLSNYYACHSSASGCGYESDTSDPSVWGSCLSYIQYCLESKAMSQSRSNQSVQNQISCPAGTVSRDGACVSNDQACNNKFGQNWKWVGTKNDTGGLNCGCKDGYANKNGECVSYDQSCNLEFPNTVFNKINDTTGGIICDCKTGYVWNDQRNSCIVAPAVDRDKQCKEKWPNSSLIGQYCDCESSYKWNQDRTQCVAIQKEKTTELKTADSLDDVTKLLKELENLKNTISDLDTSDNQETGVQEKIKLENFVFDETKVKNFTSKISTTLKMSAAFRDCPSKECGVVRYYVEDANVILIAGYDNNNWLKAEMLDNDGSLLVGWMHNSVLDKFDVSNKSKIKDASYQSSSLSNDTSTTTIEHKNSERKSAWKRIKGFFGF